MAHHIEVDNNVLVYTGGRIPEHQRSHFTHVVVDESVSVINREAFMLCDSLVSVQLHEGVIKIGYRAFEWCRSLQRINSSGVKIRVKIIGGYAFHGCEQLRNVDFGDKLEKIGNWAFNGCTYLNSFAMPSVRSIGRQAFFACKRLTVAEFGEEIETIGLKAFKSCHSLTHVAIPAKEGLFPDPDDVFEFCENLATVEVVGRVHKTVASLNLDSWKNEILKEIEKINQDLPNASSSSEINRHLLDDSSLDKTSVIIKWMATICSLITHYKTEHVKLVEEAMGMLNKAISPRLEEKNLTTDVDITPGENFVVDNVLPYLQLN